MADGIILEKLGTKAVVLLTDGFVRNGVATANRLGIPDYQFIAVPHPKWTERPIVVAVAREGRTPTIASIHAHLESRVARWWLPDAIELVDALPKTGTGKYQKTVLRERFRDRLAAGDIVPAGMPESEATPRA